ncbi:MAG: hypothetical protein WCD57_14950 [Acidobacteriaceae bacterium]
MNRLICGRLFLVGACLIFGRPCWGQQSVSERPDSPRLEVSILYDAVLSNVVRSDQFWMQGGSIQVAGQFKYGLGVEADISGLDTQNANNAGVGLDLVTATFGPRYRWSPAGRRYSVFGHALVGEAFGFNSVFPGPGAASGSANSLALQIGGGLDWQLKNHLRLRPFEADWLRTQLPNAETGVQNNTRLTTGVVFSF